MLRTHGLNQRPIIYVIVASLARMATGGSTVALLLLAAAHQVSGATLGGLAACLTLPHLLGPILGRSLDSGKDVRPKLGIGFWFFGGCLMATAMSFGRVPFALSLAILIMAGASAPFLMGGISSQVSRLFGDHPQVRKKAQSWDVASYAVGTTLGPLLVALSGEKVGAQSGLLLLGGLPLLASLLLSALPDIRAEDKGHTDTNSIIDVVHALVTHGPLCRTLYLTMGCAFATAVLPLCAIFLVAEWGEHESSAALLSSIYGLGNILGAAWLIYRPLATRRAERSLQFRAFGMVLGLVGVLFCLDMYTGLAAYLVLGVCNALFFAASLAARSEYSPPAFASQVFMWIAAMKIGAVSVGSYVAGMVIGSWGRLPLLLGAAVILLLLVISLLQQRRAAHASLESKIG